MLFLTKKQKTKNKRIFAFLIKKNKKQTIRESLLFLTKKQKTQNKGICVCLNKNNKKKKKKKYFKKKKKNLNYLNQKKLVEFFFLNII